LTSWLYEVVDKIIKLKDLLRNINKEGTSADLSSLFNPMTFFHILKQEAAKKMTCPINKLKIFCSFDEKHKLASSSSLDTIDVRGIKLQGVAYAKNVLCKVNKFHPEFLPIPSLNIFIRSSDEDPIKTETNSCYCTAPLFSDHSRQEILAEFCLPCLPDDKNKWILASVALFINQ